MYGTIRYGAVRYSSQDEYDSGKCRDRLPDCHQFVLAFVLVVHSALCSVCVIVNTIVSVIIITIFDTIIIVMIITVMVLFYKNDFCKLSH